MIQHQSTGLTKLVHLNNLQAADPDTVWDNFSEGYGRFTEPSNLKKTGTGPCPFGEQPEDQPEGERRGKRRRQPMRNTKLAAAGGTQHQLHEPYQWPTLAEWSRLGQSTEDEGDKQGEQAEVKTNSEDQVPRKRKLNNTQEGDDVPGKVSKSEQHSDNLGRVLRSATRRMASQAQSCSDGQDTQGSNLVNRKRVTLDITECEPPKRLRTEDSITLPATTPAGASREMNVDIHQINCRNKAGEKIHKSVLKNKGSHHPKGEMVHYPIGGKTLSKAAQFVYMIAKSMTAGRFE